jgi:hypothetical protein
LIVMTIQLLLSVTAATRLSLTVAIQLLPRLAERSVVAVAATVQVDQVAAVALEKATAKEKVRRPNLLAIPTRPAVPATVRRRAAMVRPSLIPAMLPALARVRAAVTAQAAAQVPVLAKAMAPATDLAREMALAKVMAMARVKTAQAPAMARTLPTPVMPAIRVTVMTLLKTPTP